MLKLIILIPIFEDFKSVKVLYNHLQHQFIGYDLFFLIVDDGSYKELNIKDDLNTKKDVEFITLNQNLGHQRSIAIGLCYLLEKKQCDFVLLMDGDGEDNPKDAHKLVEYSKQTKYPQIVFARRDVRSEPITFKIGYLLYKLLFNLTTGQSIKFGNFSCIPFCLIERIVGVPEIWNHYACSILKSGIPKCEISTTRSQRIHGRPKMNYKSLIIHGLSAISLYNEQVLLRVLMFFLLFQFIITSVIINNLFNSVQSSDYTNIYWIYFSLNSIFCLNLFINLLSRLSLRSTIPSIPKLFWKNFVK